MEDRRYFCHPDSFTSNLSQELTSSPLLSVSVFLIGENVDIVGFLFYEYDKHSSAGPPVSRFDSSGEAGIIDIIWDMLYRIL